MNLGNNIKYYRTQNNMTQEELAELLGTTAKSISRWELSVTYPDITLLPYIANIFMISVDELLGVERIKQEEYIKTIKKQAENFIISNDYNSELKLWQDAYMKLPNNEEIQINLINIMNTINIMTNKVKYSEEIIKLAQNILNKSNNSIVRVETIQCLVNLYSQMDNIEMANFYSKQLPNDLLMTKNIMQTRYLKDNDLLLAIQKNIATLVTEIMRESEFIIYDNRMSSSNKFKKEYLERLVEIEKLFFVKEDDYGSEAVPIIFNYISLLKLEIVTTNAYDKVIKYINEISKAIDYIVYFKPHMKTTPFLNIIECKHIGCYANVLDDLKNNILKELNDNILEQYSSLIIYRDLINKINTLE